jgi:hypothetical protein
MDLDDILSREAAGRQHDENQHLIESLAARGRHQPSEHHAMRRGRLVEERLLALAPPQYTPRHGERFAAAQSKN